MSVGSNAPKSQGTPPQVISRTIRTETRQGHRVSFKLTKPKPSKTRYLTTSELTGIGISLLLSCAISGAIVYIVLTYTPMFFGAVVELYNEIADDYNSMQESVTSARRGTANVKLSRFATPLMGLNCSTFASKYDQKDAVVFQSGRKGSVYDQISHLLRTKYSEVAVDLVKIENLFGSSPHLTLQASGSDDVAESKHSSVSLTLNEFQRFEFSLNDQMESGRHFISDFNLLLKLPDVESLLTTPSLPNAAVATADAAPSTVESAATNECTLRNPPFRDFRAVSVSMGKDTAAMSGSPFHAHRQSLSELIYGRKHWVIFPPNHHAHDSSSAVSGVGFNPFENLQYWQEHVYNAAPAATPAESSSTSAAASQAPSKMIEIIQEAGQVVYVPEGWLHATKTLSPESLSVRYEPPAEEPGLHYYYLVRGDAKVAAGEFAGAVKLYRLGLAIAPRDAALQQHLAYALERLQLFAEAEQAYKEALLRNPRDPYTFALLVNLLVSHSAKGKDASGSVGELLQRAESLQLKDTVLKLMRDVF